MARALPAPIYTTTVSTPAPLSTSLRALSTTSPGTTDSVATTSAQGLQNPAHIFLLPEAAAGTNVSGEPPAIAPITRGWVFDIIPNLAPAGAIVSASAGIITLEVHYSRANTIGTGNTTGTYKIYFVRVSSDLTTALEQIGSAETGTITWATAEASITLNVPVSATVYQPGEKLLMVVAAIQRSTAVLSAACQFRTNSTTGTRITSTTVTYTTTFAANLADNTPVADSVTRQYAGSRALNDSMPVTDSLARAATFRRTMTDSMPVTDSLARVFTANRALADNIPVNDALARRFTGSRNIADNVPVNDAITRRVTYARGLLEAYREGGGSTIINVRRPVYVVED